MTIFYLFIYKDIESKSSRRSKSSSEKRKDTTDEDDREDEELDWSHKVKLLYTKIVQSNTILVKAIRSLFGGCGLLAGELLEVEGVN